MRLRFVAGIWAACFSMLVAGLLASPTVAAAPATPSPSAVASSSTAGVVSWPAVSGATKYRLYWGTNPDGTGRAKIETSGTSVSIGGLRPGTKYYVRMASLAGSAKSAYSPDVSWTTPSSGGGGGDPADIDVASYNVWANNTAPSGHSWASRRDAVQAMITSRMPDVIGLQEASQNPVSGGTSSDYFFFDDVIADTSYAVTNRAAYNCEHPWSPVQWGDTSKRCYGSQMVDQGASAGTRIAYNTTTMTLEAEGSRLLSDFSETQGSTYNDRYMAWAIFHPTAGGASYFFVSTHLDPSNLTKRLGERDRLLTAVDELNTDDLPVVMVGDFNTASWDGSGAYNSVIQPIKDAGYRDPLGTQSRSYHRATTGLADSFVGHPNCDSITHFRRKLPLASNPIGGQKDCWYSGYDQLQHNGNNIDYIFTKGVARVKEWETVINLDSTGNIVGVIPSDHNMIRAIVTVD